MNVDHLREFVVLAKVHNFTRAARELNVAQSTLSKHVSALEDELGLRLFDRLSGMVVLTEGGKALFEGTVVALEGLDKAIVRARVLAETEGTAVRIGGYLQISSVSGWIYRVETVAHELSIPLRVSLYAPHTTDYMPESSRDDALELLDRRLIDVAVIEGPLVFPELDRYNSRRIFDEPIVFFAPAVSELAAKVDVGIGDLRGRKFVGSLNYPQFQERVRELCGAYGFEPDICIKMADTFNEFMRPNDPNEVFFLSGSGACRVPEPPYSPLVKLRMADPGAFSPVYLVWNREPCPAVRGFLVAVEELAKRSALAAQRS